MLCRPSGASARDLVVVIGNTGGDPHYGFARFSVELARTLAAEGIASLRLDFAGLGDSRPPGGDADAASHIFDIDRLGDFSAALDALEALGYRRFAVQGLCSGAYHAFHAAVREPRIGAAMLLNMPLFSWRPGDSIEYVNRKITRTPGYYLANAVRREVWMRLARGELDVTGIIGSQLARVWEDGVEKLRRLAGMAGWRGAPNPAQRSLQTLARRGARTLFLLADGDPGVTELERQFGAGLARLGEVPGVTLRIEADLDHMMTGRDMRRKAAAMVLRFIKREPL
jgi:pimeloyl-ACP methyl ester carboxylesterase